MICLFRFNLLLFFKIEDDNWRLENFPIVLFIFTNNYIYKNLFVFCHYLFDNCTLFLEAMHCPINKIARSRQCVQGKSSIMLARLMTYTRAKFRDIKICKTTYSMFYTSPLFFFTCNPLAQFNSKIAGRIRPTIIFQKKKDNRNLDYIKRKIICI